MASAQRHGLLTVAGGGNGLDVGRGLEQGHQTFADYGLVVDDHHPDGSAHWLSGPAGAGSRSSTRHPPSTQPALNDPPSNSARSRIPRTPYPPPVAASPCARPASSPPAGWATAGRSSTTTTICSSGVSPAWTVTDTSAPGACLRTLVSASCTIRSTASPVGPARRAGSPSIVSSAAASVPAR